ncbi:hypothetical protein AVEN_42752-1 [Araneus ventricosus]|uniref:Uncharacterized protein n=1 Tax=Araneus ventricosus TaxID=182803 RepID=A0A4Y2AG05_ARAVE|nr:hypothetical protein AVEN_42752-1 [Araneus ventricosus]
MSLLKFVLRAVNHCPIFNENPEDFDEIKLPTKKDVLLCCLEVRRQVGLESESNKETDFSTVVRQVAIKLNIIWDKASIPTVTHNRDKNVPVLERQFLFDQRGPRIGRIASVDLTVTKGMIKRAEWPCKRLRPEISLSESSYSNAVSHSLSNGSQHFGNGDDVAGVENKAENNFVKDDMFTKPKEKISKSKLDLTESVIIAQRYNASEYITNQLKGGFD